MLGCGDDVSGHAFCRVFVTSLVNNEGMSTEEALMSVHHNSVIVEHPYMTRDNDLMMAKFRAFCSGDVRYSLTGVLEPSGGRGCGLMMCRDRGIMRGCKWHLSFLGLRLEIDRLRLFFLEITTRLQSPKGSYC